MIELPQVRWLPDGFRLGEEEDLRRPLYMFILKVASRCNLDCSYCYVYQSPDQSWKEKPKFASLDVVRTTASRIAEHVETHGLEEVTVVFHGGEPLLAGVNRFTEYLREIRDRIPCRVEFGMQTNGTLLNERFLSLFADYNVRIGISLDGSSSQNDRYRLYRNGKSSYEPTLAGIDLLLSKPEYRSLFGGVLSVIDLRNDPSEFLRALDSLGIGGTNLLLPDCNHESLPERPNGSADEYGRWFAKIFELWISDYSHIEIPYFEEIINLMLGGDSASEEIGAKSVDFIVVETNGDLESVDTLKKVGREATRLGLNVRTNSFDDALTHPAVYSRMMGYSALCQTCQECEFLACCGGGYLPHRYSHENGFVNPSVYCEDLKHLFRTIRNYLTANPISENK